MTQVLSSQPVEAKTAQTYPQNSSQQYQAELERAIEERTQKGSLFDGFFTSKVPPRATCLLMAVVLIFKEPINLRDQLAALCGLLAPKSSRGAYEDENTFKAEL